MKVLIWIGVLFLCALIQNIVKSSSGMNIDPSSAANVVSSSLLAGIGAALLYGGGIALAVFLCRLWDKHKNGKNVEKTDSGIAASEIREHNAESVSRQTDNEEFKRKNRQIEIENADDPQYGLAVDSPVFVDGKDNKSHYLDCLCTKEGEVLSFHYKKSVLTKNICGLVEQYGAYRTDGSLYGTVFISVYGTQNAAKAPEGYKLSNRYGSSVSKNAEPVKEQAVRKDGIAVSEKKPDSKNDWVAVMKLYAPYASGDSQKDFAFCRDLYTDVFREMHDQKESFNTSTSVVKEKMHEKYAELDEDILDQMIDRMIGIISLRESERSPENGADNTSLTTAVLENGAGKAREEAPGYRENPVVSLPTEADRKPTGERGQFKGLAAETKKRLMVLCTVLLLVCSILALILLYIVPQTRYNAAKASLENQDFDTAIAVFSELGRFKDAGEMLKKSNYEKAESLMNDRQYAEAITIFEQLGPYESSQTKMLYCQHENTYLQAIDDFENKRYEDAADKFNSISEFKQEAAAYADKSYYTYAKDLFEKGNYTAAADFFAKADNYENAAEMVQESYYRYGLDRFEKKEYDLAYTYLSKVKSYKDVAERYDEICYQYGCSLLADKDWSGALEIFYALGDYSDSKEKALETRYDYAVNHKNRSSKTTYKYLSALKEAGYKDSAAIYDELFGWKATVAFRQEEVSDDETVLLFELVNSIQKEYPIDISKKTGGYAYVHITGGFPDEEITVSFTASLPNGQTENEEFKDKASDGDYLQWHFTFTDPENWPSGTLYMKIYNTTTGELIGEGKCNIVN